MNKVKRRVIYVDAGQNENKEFQIALYDPEINFDLSTLKHTQK
ncbi:hypothetical protein [Aliarcobacter butzleri]|nr:hypothetical protein [Aliarcobacter butzleri]